MGFGDGAVGGDFHEDGTRVLTRDPRELPLALCARSTQQEGGHLEKDPHLTVRPHTPTVSPTEKQTSGAKTGRVHFSRCPGAGRERAAGREVPLRCSLVTGVLLGSPGVP